MEGGVCGRVCVCARVIKRQPLLLATLAGAFGVVRTDLMLSMSVAATHLFLTLSGQ